MPLLSRLFIKIAFGYLALSLLAGVAIAAGRIGSMGWLMALSPAWIHLLVVGWLTQLIFGVAFWLFPRHSRERPYGWTAPAWTALVLLNLGLIARAVAEPAARLAPGPPWSAVLVFSAVAQGLGALAFAAYIWPRVRPK